MTRIAAQAGPLSLFLLVAGCGGPTEQIRALEQQVATLSQRLDAIQQSQPEDLASKLATWQETSAGAMKAMDERLSALQDEVKDLSGGADSGPTGNGSHAAEHQAALWTMVEAALGVEGKPVRATDDRIAVHEAWLRHEVQALAVRGKGPRLMPKRGGIQIRGVRPDSLAAKLGIKSGDVITHVGDQPVETIEALVQALKTARSPLLVQLQRGKEQTQLSYELTRDAARPAGAGAASRGAGAEAPTGDVTPAQ